MTCYIVHISPHKTGSTYLQASFNALRETSSGAACLSPEPSRRAHNQLGHPPLVRRLRDTDKSLVAVFLDINRQGHKTVLISAEDLADLQPENSVFLKRLIGDSPVEIVFYCRRWSELLSSVWQEGVKHGGTTLFPEFLAIRMTNVFGTHTLNYSQPLRRYTQAFGRECINLVSYSNLMDSGCDIFQHFCATFLGWDEVSSPRTGRFNASMDLTDIEIVRVLKCSWFRWRQASRTGDAPSLPTTFGHLDLSVVKEAMRACVAMVRINEGLRPFSGLHADVFREFGSRLVEPKGRGNSLFRKWPM